MSSPVIDPSILVPGLSFSEAAWFVAYVAAVICLPGYAIRRLAGIRPGGRIERWALAAILGILWASVTYFALGIAARQSWHLAAVWLPVAGLALRRFRQPAHGGWLGQSAAMPQKAKSWGFTSSSPSHPNLLCFFPTKLSKSRWKKGWSTAQVLGIVLIGAFVAAHLGRVASLVAYDQDGLRLYGTFFSDKLAGTSYCAALVHEVPPRSLRFSGTTATSHYFPRLFVAATCRTTGIDFVNGFWFYAPLLGIAVEGLAILAFCRRFFGSYWLGCAALLLHGLSRFGPEQKPLDLSFAMLLVGILAIARCQASRRWRWGILAVCLIGAMPWYEVFHAATVLAGLAAWWTAGMLKAVSVQWRHRQALASASSSNLGTVPIFAQRKWDCPLPESKGLSALAGHVLPHASWRDVRFRTAIAGAACLAALAAVRLLYLDAAAASPPEVIAQNSYRDSYKHEWRDLLRESDGQNMRLAKVYYWKRGKPVPVPEGTESAQTVTGPSSLQRLAAKVVYELGFAAYFFVRFLNIAVFGCAALIVYYRRNAPAWKTTGAIVAAVALVGFGVPFFVTWGHFADGQWWETPNIYRFTTCGYVLLVLVGTGMMIDVFKKWRRPRYWAAAGIVAVQIAYLVGILFTPTTAFHRVDRDRLEALAFLRTEVPFGQVVIHPWIDDLIRDDRRPEEVSWVYKRHFMLGANLAGQQMYFEGQEDHSFASGRIAPEEVYRRSRLRRTFYESPDSATVDEVVRSGGVEWVVSDVENVAPPRIRSSWHLAYRNATVEVYRRPSEVPRIRRESSPAVQSLPSLLSRRRSSDL